MFSIRELCSEVVSDNSTTDLCSLVSVLWRGGNSQQISTVVQVKSVLPIAVQVTRRNNPMPDVTTQ